MAQHDYVIANGTGAAVRSDLNNALAAIVSQNSGATEPATTYAYQFWADTTTNLLKLRNSANSAWITLFQLDGEWSTLPVENGTAAAPSIYFKDSGTDTGFYSPGTDQVGISTGGTARLTIDANGNVAVDTNTLYVDAPNNRVGIGTSSPSSLLHLSGGAAQNLTITRTSSISTAGDPYGYIDFIGENNLGSGPPDYSARIVVAHDSALGAGTRGSTLSFYTQFSSSNAGERMRIDSSGRVGIGTTGADTGEQLRVKTTTGNTGLTLEADGVGPFIRLLDTSSSEWAIGVPDSSSAFAIFQGRNEGSVGTERARIDSSGRLLVGTSTSAVSYSDWRLQISGQAVLGSYLGATTSAYNFNFIKSRSSSVGTYTIVASGDKIGGISFNGDDGTDYETTAASIEAYVDGTPGANDMPGRLVFSTTADGAASPTERMRITQGGTILIGKTANDQTSAGMQFIAGGRASFATNGSYFIFVNSNTNDGNLIELAQAGTIEGTISVSGTTVSYNGAHLSRWSQLPSGSEREEILRGTVLSNINEMCEWGDEENEQLNRMKVSDVEGDKNVSGVFQGWDDDDDTYTNDFYCAMTGDFIIRIGAGVTVERGDLLMSAGDGTAKPQDDDITRSKTIAKVTSTYVSCTYDDGSYCVPCVLMAC